MDLSGYVSVCGECVYLYMNHCESVCLFVSGVWGVCIFVSERGVSGCECLCVPVSVCMRVCMSLCLCGSAPLQLGWAQAL